MTRRRLAVVALIISAVLGTVTPAFSAPNPITVTVDRTAISTSLGHKFTFRSVIANHGAATARDLIAHLNVLSLRKGTYVDPEDWSSHRTQYLKAIPAGGSATTTWQFVPPIPNELTPARRGPDRPSGQSDSAVAT
jgi:hypothetical protein